MKQNSMKLALLLALVIFLPACGGGGGGGGGGSSSSQTQITPKFYGFAANTDRGDNCSLGWGVAVATGYRSESAAKAAAERQCIRAGSQTGSCDSSGIRFGSAYRSPHCVAYAYGDAGGTGRCGIRGKSGMTETAARSTALSSCQEDFSSCRIVTSACSTTGPARSYHEIASQDNGRNNNNNNNNRDPGVDRSQVGNEFGRTSTTGRTHNLTCTNRVIFSNQGNVVLPSVDVVNMPVEAGTVTLDYNALDIPDRFVVESSGRIQIDTQYVGTRNTVAEVNAVLRRHGFSPTSQSRIISPGSGQRSFFKPAGVTQSIVRVFAPLEGTAWRVTLSFSGSSCGNNGNTGNTGNTGNRGSLSLSITDGCNDGYNFQYRFFESTRRSSSDPQAWDGGSIGGSWPGGDQVYITQGLGQLHTHNLACTPGHGVCYGANQRDSNSNRYWGADIDVSERCTSCCITCPQPGQRRSEGWRLTCN